MPRRILTVERLVASFRCVCMLFNYPLLYLFDRSTDLLSAPMIYAYLFAAWPGLIAVEAWLIEPHSD